MSFVKSHRNSLAQGDSTRYAALSFAATELAANTKVLQLRPSATCISPFGTMVAQWPFQHPRSSIGAIVMGNRLFWAMLWVIGLPLPLVVILYMLFGHS